MERYFEIRALSEADEIESVCAVYPDSRKNVGGARDSLIMQKAEEDAKEGKCRLYVWRETDLDTGYFLTKSDIDQIETRYENALLFKEYERAEALAGILRMVGRTPSAGDMNPPERDKEDKAEILNALTPVLRLTRAGADISRIDYEKDSTGEERAYIAYNNSYRKSVNISGNSGKAIIEEVTRAIG